MLKEHQTMQICNYYVNFKFIGIDSKHARFILVKLDLRIKTKLKKKESHYAIVRDAVPYLLQASPRTRLVGLAGIRVTEGRSRVLHAGIDILQTVHERFRHLAAVHFWAELVRGVHQTLQFFRRFRFRDVLDTVEQRRSANGREGTNGRTGQRAACRHGRGRCYGAGGGCCVLPTPRVSHLCEKDISYFPTIALIWSKTVQRYARCEAHHNASCDITFLNKKRMYLL